MQEQEALVSLSNQVVICTCSIALKICQHAWGVIFFGGI